jgi:hypothetical protein
MRTHHQFIVKFVKNIFTIWTPNIIKKVKNVLSSVLHLLQAVRYYFTLCYRTALSIIDCQFLHSFKKSFQEAKFLTCRVDELQLWNCFSYWPSVHTFDFLAGLDCKFKGKDKNFYAGQYLFTIDWAHPETNILNTEHSEIPQEHKCAHILALANGNYAAQPNNRILWHVNNYTTDTKLARL